MIYVFFDSEEIVGCTEVCDQDIYVRIKAFKDSPPESINVIRLECYLPKVDSNIDSLIVEEFKHCILEEVEADDGQNDMYYTYKQRTFKIVEGIK